MDEDCEGCGDTATRDDAAGVPLCEACYLEMSCDDLTKKLATAQARIRDLEAALAKQRSEHDAVRNDLWARTIRLVATVIAASSLLRDEHGDDALAVLTAVPSSYLAPWRALVEAVGGLAGPFQGWKLPAARQNDLLGLVYNVVDAARACGLWRE